MVIPQYPESVPLSLDHKSLLDPLFQAMQPQVSELTFANLYLFRGNHAYQVPRSPRIVTTAGALTDRSLIVFHEVSSGCQLRAEAW